MWQLRVLSGLMVTSFCLGALHYHPQPGPDDVSRPLNFEPHSHTSVPPLKPTKMRCGDRHFFGIDRSSQYKEGQAYFGEFPWTVAINLAEPIDPRGSGKICAGSLIHPKVVLTSASCIAGYRAQGIKIQAGEWNLWEKNKQFPSQVRTVRKLRFHPESSKLGNDFAIIIVSRPFEISPHIDVVCLPYEDDEFEDESVKFMATGWGRNTTGGPYQPTLKAVKLPIVLRDKCQEDLQANVSATLTLQPNSICAGGKGGVDMCEGDSGAPLVYMLETYDPNPYVQVGVASWNARCGTPGIPGVYSKVTAARRWIDDLMTENGLDTSTYSYQY